jgi:hypothetical protein
MSIERLRILGQKWSLALRVVPVILLVGALKYIYHQLGLEILEVSPFMSGLIGANIFLLGFLVSSVLIDYKESEKLPGELAASLMSIFDEVSSIYKLKRTPIIRRCLDYTLALSVSLKNWFYKIEHTDPLMDKLAELNDHLADLRSETDDGGAIGRIKAEQSSIRRNIIRARTIRGTFFSPSGYAIAEAMNIVVILGLLLTQIDNFFASVFFVGFITFVNTYMLLLIKELDNPFDYYTDKHGTDEVSLMPLDEVIRRGKLFIDLVDAKMPARETPVPLPLGNVDAPASSVNPSVQL